MKQSRCENVLEHGNHDWHSDGRTRVDSQHAGGFIRCKCGKCGKVKNIAVSKLSEDERGQIHK